MDAQQRKGIGVTEQDYKRNLKGERQSNYRMAEEIDRLRSLNKELVEALEESKPVIEVLLIERCISWNDGREKAAMYAKNHAFIQKLNNILSKAKT